MKGSEAIEVIVRCVDGEFIIACNGIISRKLFAAKDRRRNFYMLGSMGLASAIGLGVALAKPDQKTVVLSGDGNVLMALGTLATIGKAAPKNLVHVVLDNECHESTGGQDTASSTTALDAVADSCQFKSSQRLDSAERLEQVFRSFLNVNGPSLIHAKIDRERFFVPRIPIEPLEIKKRFMKELRET